MPIDPFLLDAEQLRGLASDPIVRRGISYFREQRVTDLTWDDRHVRACVHGSQKDAPYDVSIDLGDEQELLFDCTCPFEWEPACKHIIATLLAYGARQPMEDTDVRDAADMAVEERAKRGRGEVAVEHLTGDPWFGTWEAWTLDKKIAHGPRYRVEIRGLAARINTCTCPDFATNRLGTCKHVESVLHRLRRKSPARFRELAASGPPIPVVHLAWDVPNAPIVRLHRPRELDSALAAELDPWFERDGSFRGALPDAFHRFRAECAGATVLIGDDVENYVRRIAEDAAHCVRASRIRDEIARAGGQLPGVSARLYPYQVEGVAFLAANGRALLADDMGLGKTLQAIAAATWLHEREGVRRALVVCPASLKHQWAREIERFTGREVVVVQGGPQARGALYRRGAPFTVINYELVMRDATVLQELLRPDLLILDEAQRIKNWRTQIARAIKSLRTSHAFVLTGTPLENRLEDLYSLMQVIDPRVLGPLWRFLLEFHVTDVHGKVIGYRNLAELRRRLSQTMLRRDRRLVRDQLPSRLDLRLDVPLDAKQQELHDTALSGAASIANIAKRRPLTPIEEERFMQLLQRARMACDAAGLVDGETCGSPKLEELARLFEELCVDGGRKIVVFSQWERMTAMAEEVAQKLGLGTVRLHGGVPSEKRGELIDRFREDPAVQVFISTDAGGVGLNLQVASAVVNLDVPWNPAVLEQRIARVHRLGQREPVQVVVMIGAESYEARIAQLIRAKQNLFDNVVATEATEDVVGISRKSIELALESVDGAENANGHEAKENATEELILVAPAADTALVPREAKPEVEPEETESVAVLVAALDKLFGSRLERVLAAAGGLVAVLDEVRQDDEARADALGAELPVALVDTRTASALARLGASSPLSGREVLRRETSAEPSELQVAKRRLRAAETLVAESCGPEAMDLAVAAMVTAVAFAGGAPPPPTGEAAVWLYQEALPRGWATAEDAMSVLRAAAMARAPMVPREQAESVLRDARAVLTRATPFASAPRGSGVERDRIDIAEV